MPALALALLAATAVESALERLSEFKGTWSCTEKTLPDRPFYEVRIESALPRPDHPDEWALWTEFDCVRMGAP